MMKAIFVSLLCLLTAATALSAGKGWTTDLNAALAAAKKQKKHVLVEFTGSDWCERCIYMRKNVFSKPSFTSRASRHYILVELDFPQGNKAVAKRNEVHAKRYHVAGFPTVLLLDSNGREYDRFQAARYPSPSKFLAHLDAARAKAGRR